MASDIFCWCVWSVTGICGDVVTSTIYYCKITCTIQKRLNGDKPFGGGSRKYSSPLSMATPVGYAQ